MSPVFTSLMIPFLGTALGSAFVFFLKREMPELVQKVLLGFASGVMVAASVWSLLIPAMEMGEGASAVVAPVIGLLAGFAFLLLIDYVTPHLHANGEAEGPRSRLSRTAKLALAVTIHNFPEGMAVGVAIAGALTADFNMAGALALSLGIAIQNIPEGAIISMPLRAEGNSRWIRLRLCPDDGAGRGAGIALFRSFDDAECQIRFCFEALSGFGNGGGRDSQQDGLLGYGELQMR